VILQVASFRLFGRRIFRMAPLHFHFDLGGWAETTTVIRFWILTGIGVALGLGLFYGDFLRLEGLLCPTSWCSALASRGWPWPRGSAWSSGTSAVWRGG